VIKTGVRGEPIFSSTVATNIVAAEALTKDNINEYFLGA
jgi:hypothetical protein